ncbi:MAG TPA: PSD1 and planctomycete cytochrome C domain-containing protein [Gemmatales bacterium]|nr:PSD1 and planctomycete cytochrome C domain-containing protein [Gemmatales bacterium]
MVCRCPGIILSLMLLCCQYVAGAGEPAFVVPENNDYFEKHVRPILADHCYSCHGPDKSKGGLRFDSIKALKTGNEAGSLFVPGKPEKSHLLEVLNYSGEIKMPPRQKLSQEQIDHVRHWIELGAVLPVETKKPENDQWKKHWSFQPLKFTTDAIPTIDSLIAINLEKASLSVAPPADRRTLLRRVKFDLLGLPPTNEEMEAFVHDALSDESALLKVVDRYLASPHFGERWARHWLDLARYADNKGYIGVGVDRTYPFAWTYRDWVVAAFNRDLPYDEFLKDQLAADQLVLKDKQADLAAMGFLTVGRRFINDIHDIIDDRIDVTMRTMQGLTVSCARCHDHKFDPISARDYYSLYGVFNSSREPDLEAMPLLGMNPKAEDGEAFNKELAKAKEELTKWEKDHEADRKEKPIQFGEQRKPFENKIKRLYADHPGAPPRGMVLLDKDKPVEPVIFNRGNPGNRGARVPRQFLPFLSGEKEEPFKVGSGRLELAKAITNRSNPLTARVWANRVWEHLIGKPLVNTPSDFGLRSEPPANPKLLDALAASLLKNNWSTKQLIRDIILSKAYRQSSDSPDSWRLDPENKLLARMNRKRLEWEPMRDSILAVSGQLDATMGGPSVDMFKKGANRRSIYAFIDRQNLPSLFRTFDFAIPDTHSPSRFTTTVPQQMLYFMNSGFLMEHSRALLERTEIKSVTDPTERIHRCYQLILARDALPEEVQLSQRFLGTKPDDKNWQRFVQALLMTNEFIFVD